MYTCVQMKDAARAYWRQNLATVTALLAVWFLVSLGAGVLFVEPLNRVRLPGTGIKLGFWFAQEGSILIFVALIVIYVRRMNRLDRAFGVDEGEADDARRGQGH